MQEKIKQLADEITRLRDREVSVRKMRNHFLDPTNTKIYQAITIGQGHVDAYLETESEVVAWLDGYVNGVKIERLLAGL